jgi:hypothetical protein
MSSSSKAYDLILQFVETQEDNSRILRMICARACRYIIHSNHWDKDHPDPSNMCHYLEVSQYIEPFNQFKEKEMFNSNSLSSLIQNWVIFDSIKSKKKGKRVRSKRLSRIRGQITKSLRRHCKNKDSSRGLQYFTWPLKKNFLIK